jgi:hypothetical protein
MPARGTAAGRARRGRRRGDGTCITERRIAHRRTRPANEESGVLGRSACPSRTQCSTGQQPQHAGSALPPLMVFAGAAWSAAALSWRAAARADEAVCASSKASCVGAACFAARWLALRPKLGYSGALPRRPRTLGCDRDTGGSVSAMADDEQGAEEPEPDDPPRRKWLRRSRKWGHGRGRGGRGGGAGVREPRRPRPGSDTDAVEVEPEDRDE